MGLRFRKSFKAGPFRINLSKSGVGYSVGTKGFRVTKKANGGVRTTASIPGTGISYINDTNSKKSTSPQKSAGGKNRTTQESERMDKPKNTKTELLLCLFLGWAGGHKFYRKKIGMGILYLLTLGLFCIGWWGDLISLCLVHFGKKQQLSNMQRFASYLIAFLCFAVMGSCNADTSPAVDSVEPTIGIEATAESITVETSAPTEASTEPVVTEAPTDAPTEAPTEPPKEDPTEAVTEAPAEPEEVETTYVLNTSSKKFHYESCRGVDDMNNSNKKYFTGTRDEVIAMGYDSCGICHP